MTHGASRLEITGIAAGGDGVGRTEGMVVFVPRTAPGDVAMVRLTRSKRFARGRLESIEQPSPDRVTPPCRHYTIDRCGGCQIQHLSYEAQLRGKGSIIRDSIARIGRREIGTVDVEPSDAQWRYRRKLTLHVRRAGSRWIAGLHPYDDPVAVFDLIDCPITDERLMAVWSELRTAFNHLPPDGEFRISARMLEDGAAVVVEGGSSWPAVERFFAAVPTVVELWWKPEQGRLRRLAARTVAPQAGASFVQVNARVAARLRAHVVERVRAHAPRRVVDGYAGSGEIALALAASGVHVTAIELDAEAVARFENQLRQPSYAVVGRVEDNLQRALPADVVLLNPPRAGVDAAVTTLLQSATNPPACVIYTSCDPGTLARDLARMPRYALAGVRAYDMFPQTAHVETVCELKLEGV